MLDGKSIAQNDIIRLLQVSSGPLSVPVIAWEVGRSETTVAHCVRRMAAHGILVKIERDGDVCFGARGPEYALASRRGCKL